MACCPESASGVGVDRRRAILDGSPHRDCGGRFPQHHRLDPDQFGDKQTLVYADTITGALEVLSDGPTTIGVKERPEIGKGLFTLHVARGNRGGRHFVLFRVADKGRTRTIEVLRLLHDAIDLNRHRPGEDDR